LFLLVLEETHPVFETALLAVEGALEDLQIVLELQLPFAQYLDLGLLLALQ